MILVRPLRFSVFVILLAVGVALRAGPLARSADTGKGAQAALTGSRPFVLTVLGPDGKVLPSVPVEVRCEPALMAAQVRKGRFLRAETAGVFVQASDQGRVVLELAKDANRLDMLIETVGYAPYFAQWGLPFRPEPVPADFTARLEAGWSVGGIIDDGEGRPVAGVHVIPRIPYQRPPGDYRGSDFAHFAVTDAAGKWHFDSVPASLTQVVLVLDHPDFMPRNCRASRAEFGLDHAREPGARMFLKRGMIISGTVSDESGRPISGALVRTAHRNARRQAVTGPDGVYRLRGCGPWEMRIVASAQGCAMTVEDRTPSGDPVDFTLVPGGKIRVHAHDERNRPVRGYCLLFEEWEGEIASFEFDIVNRNGDDRGIWEWREAPLDPVRAQVCRPGSTSVRINLDAFAKREYDVCLPSPTVVSGRVVDRETKQPIRKFRLVVTRRLNGTPVVWYATAASLEADGTYHVPLRSGFADARGIRIEAHGYEPGESRDIKSDEGLITIDFELKRGTDIEGVVLAPEGHPAEKARVALVPRATRLTITNGAIDPQETDADWRETDAAGRFQFPPQNSPFSFVVTHSSGYASYRAAPRSNRRIINLDPWTRVEGTYRVGGKLLANIPIGLAYGRHGPTRFGVPHVITTDITTTDANGHYEFRHVMAGSGFVHRTIGWAANGDEAETQAEAPSASATEVPFPLGKTMRLDLKERGRQVIGRLGPPDGVSEPVPWQRALVELKLDRGDIREANPRFAAVVAADGTFRSDNLFPGAYRLDVHFPMPGFGQLWESPVFLSADDKADDKSPLDLGVLTLEKE